jgi:tetratricopeptide (TPR) repeat protein
MRTTRTTGIALALCTVVGLGCGGGAKEAKTGGTTKGGDAVGAPAVVAQKALDQFNAALDSLNSHDKANDWNDQTCADVAKQFLAATSANDKGKFPESTYDAGLAYQRCGDDKDAKAQFQQAIADDPKFHYARAQLALYQYKADGNADAAISALEQAVTDANFQDVPALVDLAMFQMTRDSDQVGANCSTTAGGKSVDLKDFDCAKLNLQRALAIDDGYMPAFNQLALYYFGSAKKKAGGKKIGRTIATNAAIAKRGDVQQLDLAALVCSQAVQKSPKYAPIHNTSGLILNELGQVNSAVKEFQAAAQFDPHFFEAQMNLAAINLSFRGFDKAEAAYRKALEMHPNDYDAHLGLALALRGQINDSNYDAQVTAVQAELDACKKIDAARPDAYYNEGILTQEYKAKSAGGTDKAIPVYQAAKTVFQTFMDKASGKSEYDGAIKKTKERMQDIDDTVTFLQAGGPPTGSPPSSPAPSDSSGAAAAAPSGGASAGSAAPAPSSSASAPAGAASASP